MLYNIIAHSTKCINCKLETYYIEAIHLKNIKYEYKVYKLQVIHTLYCNYTLQKLYNIADHSIKCINVS